MSLPERLARSGSMSLFGSGFAALIALALTVVIANGFGAYGTGLFFQALAVFTIASQVMRLGTPSGLVKFISEQRAFGRRGEMWRSIAIAVLPVAAIATLGAVAISLYADEVAAWLAPESERVFFAEVLRSMGPFVVVGSVLAVLQTATRMISGVGVFTLLQSVLLPASRLLAVAMAIVLSWNALEAFQAYLGVLPAWLVVTIVILTRPLVRDWKVRAEGTEGFAPAVRRFWRFSGSRAIGGAFETALEWSDVLIVAVLGSPMAAGIYAVATRTVRAGQIVDRAMRLAVSPRISELLARAEVPAAIRLHTIVTRVMILINWPYYLLLATMGPIVLSIFGSQFTEGAIVLAVLAGAMMLSAAAGMLQSVLLQGGKSSWQMYNKGLILGLSIGLNVALVPWIGILGAAITWAACVVVETAIAAWQVHQRMGVRLEPKKLLLAMALPLTIFGLGGMVLRFVFEPSPLVLLIGVLILGSVYLVLLWFLRDRLHITPLWHEIPVLGRWASRERASVPPKRSSRRLPDPTKSTAPADRLR